MRAKITKQRVDSIEPGPKPIIVFDTDLPGFVLKVTPTGHRVYQVRYRIGGRGTPLRTLTLGRHGSLTPELARRQAQQVIGQVRGGIAPAGRESPQNRGGPRRAYGRGPFARVPGCLWRNQAQATFPD